MDYPDIAFPAAEAVASGEFDRGILICGTGIGVSICANKVRGIRCALCGDVLSAELTRQHNDSNMLAMGGRIIGIETAKAIVKTWSLHRICRRQARTPHRQNFRLRMQIKASCLISTYLINNFTKGY